MSARAECTWAEGPDVLVCVEGPLAFPLLQHPDGSWSFGLARSEGRRLAAELLTACERADDLERSLEEYEKKESELP